MILQPLVENAVVHGVLPHASSGTIAITAEKQDKRLRMVVWNSIRSSAVSVPKSAGTGIGLPNTRQRLQELYGADGVLTVQAGDGTDAWQVAIELPFTAVTDQEVSLVA
ncbi:MAG: hypothetical protein JO182_24020 [Acidobacteriaceae bacterium]|nr:hypothetical protein [Acidobacteriaceae bacterium]MBV9222633.1 hypothetical protein [Acidobacteriaceae bacterium]MBV9937709.1 hypothetical protein [Acidobacteriaceae bacterium]